jgi:hypothetical protein
MKLLTTIQQIPLEPDGGHTLMNYLLLSYLCYYGYVETVEALSKNLASTKPFTDPTLLCQMQSMDQRQCKNRFYMMIDVSLSFIHLFIIDLMKLVIQGDIDEAIQLTTEYFPKTFETYREVLFLLRCQQFMEHIKLGIQHRPVITTDPSYIRETLRFGLDLFKDFNTLGMDKVQFEKQLEETISTLAYKDPSQSPVKHLLLDEKRQQMAYCLNNAILSSYFQSKFSHSPLGRLTLQTQLVLQELGKTAKDPCAALVSFQQDVFYQPKVVNEE